MSRIRGRISAFDTTITHYREAFRRYSFFKHDCSNPYELLDEGHKEILMLERQMKDIQESASLFEVMVPEFKVLKQCRRELKMLKQLWDYVNIVRSCIEGWKTTPWRKIDVENMDIECKKFSKEIRGWWHDINSTVFFQLHFYHVKRYLVFEQNMEKLLSARVIFYFYFALNVLLKY